MFWSTIGNALLIFVLRITDVSMGTIRTTMIMRGQRKYAAMIGFVEVTIWVMAISRVITHLDTIWNIFAYSGGFAMGTLLGMWIEDKLAIGHANIQIVSLIKGHEIADQLRNNGYGATELVAEGRSGPVSIINVVAPRKQVADVIRQINEIDATTFVTVEDARKVVRGYQRISK
ncbi:MAG: DUF2179 domain-containing protein [Anaerolineales bacterium]|nr:DUF2179 domain-containing protein [Anaerolineales bacterium]